MTKFDHGMDESGDRRRIKGRFNLYLVMYSNPYELMPDVFLVGYRILGHDSLDNGTDLTVLDESVQPQIMWCFM